MSRKRIPLDLDEQETPTIEDSNEVQEMDRYIHDSLSEMDKRYTINPVDDRQLIMEGFTLTPIGVQIPRNTPQQHWRILGARLLQLGSVWQWCIADWFAYGDEYRWGKDYIELAARFDVEVDTLHHYAYVARKVKFWSRTPELSFEHHRTVAPIEDENLQREWLQKAIDAGWNVKQFRTAIREYRLSVSNSPADRKRRPQVAIPPSTAAELRRKVLKSSGAGESEAAEILSQISQWRAWLDELEKLLTSK